MVVIGQTRGWVDRTDSGWCGVLGRVEEWGVRGRLEVRTAGRMEMTHSLEPVLDPATAASYGSATELVAGRHGIRGERFTLCSRIAARQRSCHRYYSC